MSKILRFGEMMSCLVSIGSAGKDPGPHHPLITKAHDLAEEMADAIAAHLGITHDAVSYEFVKDGPGLDFMVGFRPAAEGQECPPVIDELDAGGEWDA